MTPEHATRPEAPRVLMEANGLKMHFKGPRSSTLGARQFVRSVDGIDIQITRGHTLGLVGESGCGKSTTARLLMRLLDPTAGTIRFEGQDITRLSQKALRNLRPAFQMIAQDPYSSLNPRMRIRHIVSEPLEIAGVGAATRREHIERAMTQVSLSRRYLDRFPHEFSGGQRQRIAIARALVTQPKLLICDEPVSALDVSVQAQILNLLQDLQHDAGLTYLFVSHDLGVVKHVAGHVAVMYLGRIVEIGPKHQVFGQPRHPYTEALLSAIPSVSPNKSKRIVLKGDIPSPIRPPPGCHFHTRCPYSQDICRVQSPALEPKDGNAEHRVACYFPRN